MACPYVAGGISRLLQVKEYGNWEILFGDLIHVRKKHANQLVDFEAVYKITDADRKPSLGLVTYILDDAEGGDGDGRPDADDLAFAAKFSSLLLEKMKNIDIESYSHSPISVDGDACAGYFQPTTDEGKAIDIRKVKPKTSDKCDNCDLCANICPMGSISPDNCSSITGICIKCGACIKKCPKGAKYFDDADFLFHKCQIERDYHRRAQNKLFV